MVAWNYKGANSRGFIRRLKEIYRINKSDFLILVETRCPSNSLEGIYRNSCFNQSIILETCSFVERIWVLWDESHIHNESLEVHEQIVAIVVRNDNKHVWVLSASYASPNAYFREDLWKYLIRLGGCVSFEWLLLGDFNQVLASSEKRGCCLG